MARLVPIGNSKGVRLPKHIIEKADLEGKEIEIVVTKEGVLLKPKKPFNRKEWKKEIEEVLAEGEKDEGVVEEFLHERLEEWEW